MYDFYNASIMFRLNRQVDYALQLVIAVSGVNRKNPLSIMKFSEESNISFLFLQKIAKKLREAGIVRAAMGSQGGYVLAKPIGRISLKDIIVAIDGVCGISQCSTGKCERNSSCKLRNKIGRINREIIASLHKTKISQLI